MYRKEDFLGALRLETVEHELATSEKKVVGDFIETLAGLYCDGLRGVDFAVLPAGDFADFLNKHQNRLERIDLRIVADAPTGSTRRERFVERLEDFVLNYLDEVNLPYTQISGMSWHSAQLSHDEESTDLVQVDSDGSHSICFEVDSEPTSRRRPIGIVINNSRERDLESHLVWEKKYRQRSPMILLNSRSPRNRIKF